MGEFQRQGSGKLQVIRPQFQLQMFVITAKQALQSKFIGDTQAFGLLINCQALLVIIIRDQRIRAVNGNNDGGDTSDDCACREQPECAGRG